MYLTQATSRARRSEYRWPISPFVPVEPDMEEMSGLRRPFINVDSDRLPVDFVGILLPDPSTDVADEPAVAPKPVARHRRPAKK
jgi:hypothetical protein